MNVVKLLARNQTSEYIIELMVVRKLINVMNVKNLSGEKTISFNIKKHTQERNHLIVMNVGKLLPGYQP